MHASHVLAGRSGARPVEAREKVGRRQSGSLRGTSCTHTPSLRSVPLRRADLPIPNCPMSMSISSRVVLGPSFQPPCFHSSRVPGLHSQPASQPASYHFSHSTLTSPHLSHNAVSIRSTHGVLAIADIPLHCPRHCRHSRALPHACQYVTRYRHSAVSSLLPLLPPLRRSGFRQIYIHPRKLSKSTKHSPCTPALLDCTAHCSLPGPADHWLVFLDPTSPHLITSIPAWCHRVCSRLNID